jgi:asparagine synthase (glutamine-hydrolysing)
MSMTHQERRVHEIRELYLPRLLKWDDRNFMAFSVEGRYPFLDHVLIETALSFDSRCLYRRGWTKEPLRRGLRSLLPAQIVSRRTKVGFATPQDRWLSGPLRPTITDLVSGDSPAWAYTSRDSARRLAERAWREQGHDNLPGQELFRHLCVDRWLRHLLDGAPDTSHVAPQPSVVSHA